MRFYSNFISQGTLHKIVLSIANVQINLSAIFEIRIGNRSNVINNMMRNNPLNYQDSVLWMMK